VANVSFAATFVAPPVVGFAFPTQSGAGVQGRMLVPAGFDVGTASVTTLRVARLSSEATATNAVGTLTATGRWF
jgi:hypothetical protein